MPSPMEETIALLRREEGTSKLLPFEVSVCDPCVYMSGHPRLGVALELQGQLTRPISKISPPPHLLKESLGCLPMFTRDGLDNLVSFGASLLLYT